MRHSSSFLFSVAVFALTFHTAHAWLRPFFEDAIVVERSELIVIAHLKEGSIQYVPHQKGPDEGASWEHHAVLEITSVLKGECEATEIPIIIHYGLRPVVGGQVMRGDQEELPNTAIEIIDTGRSALPLGPIVSDAREDNLWFLRKRSGTFGREPGTGNYGIVDPEDLQPLKLKDYFLAYMSDDPETKVKEYVEEHAEQNPEIEYRAKRYFDHLEVQRILTIEDPTERCDKLLPFYFNRTTWNMKNEAREGLVACDDVAAERLIEIFDDPERAALRSDMILMWRDIGYKKSVPLLIDLLKKHDEFLAEQDLQEGWWNDDVSSEQTRKRRAIYGEVYYGACALRAIQDPRAREILVATKKRWHAVNFDNPQIIEACEAALRELPNLEELSETLTDFVYVDASSVNCPHHPLVCGEGGDFPTGREMAFINPESKEWIHAVFTEEADSPSDLNGEFTLTGRFQFIRNWERYSMMIPQADYRYLVVLEWEQTQ